MVYRRTHQVVKRLAARRSNILAAAREAAAEGGMAAVQIAPVAVRANVAAGRGLSPLSSQAGGVSRPNPPGSPRARPARPRGARAPPAAPPAPPARPPPPGGR